MQACAVTIDDNIVITGGTMLGLGKVKPVWLAEIGTRTAEAWDGTQWRSIPSLSRAKVTAKIILMSLTSPQGGARMLCGHHLWSQGSAGNQPFIISY